MDLNGDSAIRKSTWRVFLSERVAWRVTHARFSLRVSLWWMFAKRIELIQVSDTEVLKSDFFWTLLDSF